MFMSSALAMPADWWAWEALAGTQALHNYLWFGGEVNNHNSLASWQSSIQGFWARASHLAIASEGCSSKQSKAVALWASAPAKIWLIRWASTNIGSFELVAVTAGSKMLNDKMLPLLLLQWFWISLKVKQAVLTIVSRKSKTDKSSTHNWLNLLGLHFVWSQRK